MRECSGDGNFARERVDDQIANSGKSHSKSKEPPQCKRESDVIVDVV